MCSIYLYYYYIIVLNSTSMGVKQITVKWIIPAKSELQNRSIARKNVSSEGKEYLRLICLAVKGTQV